MLRADAETVIVVILCENIFTHRVVGKSPLEIGLAVLWIEFKSARIVVNSLGSFDFSPLLPSFHEAIFSQFLVALFESSEGILNRFEKGGGLFLVEVQAEVQYYSFLTGGIYEIV